MGIMKSLDPAKEIQKLVDRLSMYHYMPTTEWWLDLAKQFESSAMEIRQRIEDAQTKAEKWDQERDKYNRTWHIVRDTDEQQYEDDNHKPGRIWACDPYRWCDDIDKDTLKYGYHELLGTVEVVGVDSYDMSEFDRIYDAVMAAFLEGEAIIHMEPSPVSAEFEE